MARDTDKIFERTLNNDLLAQHGITDDKVGYVVQQYIDRPHLIDDLKYDLRLYVLVYGVNPLRIYLHQMAFARFCTEAYERPTKRNMKNIYMHLTNYALNKQNEEYEEAEGDDGDEGHKRSLGAILQILDGQGCDTRKFMDQVKDLIVKTMITGQPNLNFNYKICQPECLDNSMAFQILGFDILIDSQFKPYLLEVNCSPSFRTDTQLDYKIKKNVILDAFKLLNFSKQRRTDIIKEQRVKQIERIKTGKTEKFTGQQREALRQERLTERFKFEASRMNGYELIYPTADQEQHAKYE